MNFRNYLRSIFGETGRADVQDIGGNISARAAYRGKNRRCAYCHGMMKSFKK